MIRLKKSAGVSTFAAQGLSLESFDFLHDLSRRDANLLNASVSKVLGPTTIGNPYKLTLTPHIRETGIIGEIQDISCSSNGIDKGRLEVLQLGYSVLGHIGKRSQASIGLS
jgi:hypothetical protein